MVEHLGPTYFSPEDWFTIVTTICQYCDHTSAGLRQASVYGIGIIAQNSGEAFGANGQLCLESLKKAIDVPITEKVQAKKDKVTEYQHAKDNAIASLGKVIRYQNAYVVKDQTMATQLVAYWIGLLPITHDLEEGQAQYEFLCDFLLGQPAFIFSGDPATTAMQLAKIFGEAF
jgi:hypothetical protein